MLRKMIFLIRLDLFQSTLKAFLTFQRDFFHRAHSNGQGTYCLQIYYSNSSEMFKTRLRNVTILPDDDNNRDDYDWQTGVSLLN